MKAWYFSTDTKKLRYDDGRQIRKGITHKIKGEPELCHNGLHASERIIDALSYAPGNYIWRVELSGEMDIGDDKIAATERTYLWGIKLSDELLRGFVRQCALDVIHLWDCPDIVREYLETGNEDLRAAAGAAAWGAVRDAAWGAAGAAAWGAARDAARAAAWGAARAAARDAAWDAARDAALESFNGRFEELIMKEAKKRGYEK